MPREARVAPWSHGQGWPLGVLGGQRPSRVQVARDGYGLEDMGLGIIRSPKTTKYSMEICAHA